MDVQIGETNKHGRQGGGGGCVCAGRSRKRNFPIRLAPLHAHLFALRILLATPPKKQCAFAVDPKGRTTASDRGGETTAIRRPGWTLRFLLLLLYQASFFSFSLRIDAGGETTKPDARIQTEYFTDLWNDSVILHAYFFYFFTGGSCIVSPLHWSLVILKILKIFLQGDKNSLYCQRSVT